MPRPSNESLLADYIRDLESDIATNAEEKKKGRTDLDAYDIECRAKLEALRNAKSVRFDQFGQPHIIE